VRGSRFYSPKAASREEIGRLSRGFDRWKKESDGVRFWKAPEEGEGKGKVSLTGGTHKSAARAENAAAAGRRRARAMTGRQAATWARPRRRRPAGGEERAARAGLRREAAREQRENKKSFFQFFKFLFQMILNPNLNLNQTTQTKNSNATA
jgi:hypothetical protein